MSDTCPGSSAGTVPFGDWRFTAEGAAIHEGERTAVIADVHLGYEWARGAAGDVVPAHSLDETVARLGAVLERAPIERLVVAGDLVESARPCRRTAEDVRRLIDWLRARGVAFVAVEGNHDRRRFPRPRGPSPIAGSCVMAGAGRLPSTLDVGGWTIAHGDRPIAAGRSISGHFHPIIRAEGVAARCFLAWPDRIILPAFSPNAAGCDVLTGPVPGDWRDPALRCIAGDGSELLDFGPLISLRTAGATAPDGLSTTPSGRRPAGLPLSRRGRRLRS